MIYLYIGIAILVIGSIAYLIYRKRRVTQFTMSAMEANEPSEASSEPPVATQETSEVMSPVVSDISSLPESAKWDLMNAVWYRCENPYCNYTQFLDVHHIVSEVEGGSNALSNLIVLCPRCHAAAHNNEIPLAVLRAWVEKRGEFQFDLNWPYNK